MQKERECRIDRATFPRMLLNKSSASVKRAAVRIAFKVTQEKERTDGNRVRRYRFTPHPHFSIKCFLFVAYSILAKKQGRLVCLLHPLLQFSIVA